ncbi:hypothetical protein [Cellulomonas soli]|uniref:Uncharacterized protein n=1 Tax=Cellulomonas soli TaxID=931535 RepID=A0A512PF64_9CELL|nr:hypothetical protein [Cellulomonas soli]NYI59365.1 hypothetical protein [Cellulomonas soli]GEP69847.1 hypothetical protein CSO01_25620 [Cellulomonas soli]
MSDRTPTGTPDEGAQPQGEGAQPRDEAFDRVRAADPAAGATADLDRLAATARDRAGLATAGAADAAAGTTASTTENTPEGATDELAEVRVLGGARTRRPARWLQIAAAVAGVAVIGGGGYALGLVRDGGGAASVADAAAPAISLEGSADQGAAGDSAASSSMAGTMAGTESKLAGDMASGWWFGGRTVFTQQGLSDEAGQGKAWGFDAASVVTQETVARIAAAFGVPGDPRQEYGSWTVGPTDGTGATVSLSPDGLASMSFYDPTLDPWAQCYASATDTTSAGAAGSDSAAVEPAPAECVPSGAPAPTGDAAVAEVRDVVADLGVDPDGWEYEVQTDTGNPQAVYLTLQQVVDGQRTGVTGSATLVADGVQSLYLPLAPVVDLGTYDVVSAVEAVQRLADPRFGPTSNGVMPLMSGAVKDATTSLVAPEGAEATEPTVPATPTAGARIAWPVQQVTLTSARLGVALTTLPDGASVLVPTYELADADGTTWSVIAVVEDQLDLTPAG